ncbi:MAG: 50S ribosomal protein L3, partial [Candidatus Brennerbacteria bacterium CG_4_8_14_3_um_filter_43_14]
MKYMIGKKLGMMQIFDAQKNTVKAVTLLDVQPVTVVQIKTQEKDGYTGVQ